MTTISQPGLNTALAGGGTPPPGGLAPKGYWNGRADRFAHRGAGLAAVCSYGMPQFYNWYIDLLQRRALASVLSGGPQEHVLEIGCGVGRWTAQLAQTSAKVVALDLSASMVHEAQNRLRHTRCRFLVADVANFALDRQFDRVLGVTVLQHILDPARLQVAIKGIAEHLAPSGVLILLEAAPARASDRCNSEVFVARDEQTYLAAFARAGLHCDAVHAVDPAPFKTWFLPWYRYLPGPIAAAALFAVTAASLPIDLWAGRWGRPMSWHKVFVLRHAPASQGRRS